MAKKRQHKVNDTIKRETKWDDIRYYLGKIWYFIWEDDSILSWIVNVILAFVLIKFLIYPGLGLLLGTQYPVVAVISSSMEHEGGNDQWWEEHHEWYDENGFQKSNFNDFDFTNGFNRGDIMVLKGFEANELEVGEVIVFQSTIRPDPIIHRIVEVEEVDGNYFYTTKGDNNVKSYTFESAISEDNIYGRAVLKLPYLGYIKIWFVDLLRL